MSCGVLVAIVKDWKQPQCPTWGSSDRSQGSRFDGLFVSQVNNDATGNGGRDKLST